MAMAEANAQKKSIYRTAIILTLITALEFVVAFTWNGLGASLGFSDGTISTMKLLIFVFMTILKAFYIVAEFMHLKHEIKSLIVTIALPFIFIVWLIIGMMIEGNYYGKLTKRNYGEVAPVEAPAKLVNPTLC